MRFVVIGAGGIGGVLAARLHQAGEAVVAVARGRHLDRWREHGVRLQTPVEDVVLDVPVVGHPRDVELTGDDVVILAMKSQDTVAALQDLVACGPPDIAIACAQNGVANEREALRRFERVYGICVLCPAVFLEPGVVQVTSVPVSGILDVGRYPDGVDETADRLAAAFRRCTFEAEAVSDIMRWKYAKLLANLGNAVEAMCEPAGADDLVRLLTTEGRAVLAGAGIPVASTDEMRARRGDIIVNRPVQGRARGGGSTWQSLARGVGSTETDFLNGEIVLLGRLAGVPAPVNAIVQRIAAHAAAVGARPASMPIADVEDLIP